VEAAAERWRVAETWRLPKRRRLPGGWRLLYEMVATGKKLLKNTYS